MTKKEKWIKIRIAEDVDWIEFQIIVLLTWSEVFSFIISFTWSLLCQGTLEKKSREAWGVVTFLEMPYKWDKKNYDMSTNV